MRRKWKMRLRQGTSFFLAAVMAAEGGMPAYGYIKPKSGTQTVAGNDGTGIKESEDWIDTFPNGVFAFKDNAVYLKEGEKKEKKITVYRLGGRDGEATAHIALAPAAAEMDEDSGELNTANAVSWNDVKVRVEDPVTEEEDEVSDAQDGSNGAENEDSSLGSKATSSEPAKTDLTENTSNSTAKSTKKSSKVTYTDLETDDEDPFGTLFVDLTFADGDFTYSMSILKSADPAGSACNRYTFDYAALPGVGHFLHTYVCDGNPLPTFQGEPERVELPDDIDAFTESLWDALDRDNRISLYVRYTDLATGKESDRLINRNK